MNVKRLFKSLLTVAVAAVTVVGASLILNTTRVNASSLVDVNVISHKWVSSGGYWYWQNSDGSWAYGWKKIDGKWYFFNKYDYDLPDYAMVTGPRYVADDDDISYNDYHYLFNGSGALVYGWAKVDGYWYHSNSSGICDRDGWFKISGKWYYFDYDGAMYTGWKIVDDDYYYFGSDGAMRTGWLKFGGQWYFLTPSGAMKTGWCKIDGKWYFFDDSGAMATGMRLIGYEYYLFNSSGAMMTGLQKVTINTGYRWYYFSPATGKMKTGWQSINGNWYYFDPAEGYMYAGGWTYADYRLCYFADDGVWLGYGD